MNVDQTKQTREIMLEQLQLLQEKSRDVKSIDELLEINSEMCKISGILLSKNFN